MSASVYESANQLFGGVNKQLAEGQEFNLRGVTLPHFPIKETALAACLVTLDIPVREPGPYTDDVALDEKGNEIGRTTLWWLGDVSRGGGEDAHKTEELLGAWDKRERFEREFPNHPLVFMRAAIDARVRWIEIIRACRARIAILPTDGRGLGYATTSLREASVLVASGFKPIAFDGEIFVVEAAHNFVLAHQVLESSESIEMTAPEQWMRRVLHLQEYMLGIVKRHSLIIRQKFDDQTLILSEDASRKTRDTFHGLIS